MEEEEEKEKDEREDEEEGDDRVDDKGTKRMKQCVSFAEFVRLMKRPQNWIRESFPAAILRYVQWIIENHQNALT